MHRGRITLALAAALAAAGPALAQAAPIRLSERNARVLAVAVTNGRAVAIVDSLDRAAPFELVSGGGSSIGTFGLRESDFPDLAVDPGGGVLAAWARPVTGGASVEAVAVEPSASDPFSATRTLAHATGPPRLAGTESGTLLAYPDRDGNLALLSNPIAPPEGQEPQRAPQPYALTSSGPHRRHLPFELVIGPDGPLVLDLVQTRRLTELRLVGAGAPAAPVTSARGVRDIPAALGAHGERVAVAYLSNGRVVLARPRAGGSWSRRTLPGPGGGTDPPAVMVAGRDVVVAYEQRVPRAGRRALKQIFLAQLRGARLRSRRLTRSHADDGRPLAAADGAGASFVAWTRVALGSGRRVPYILRLG